MPLLKRMGVGDRLPTHDLLEGSRTPNRALRSFAARDGEAKALPPLATAVGEGGTVARRGGRPIESEPH